MNTTNDRLENTHNIYIHAFKFLKKNNIPLPDKTIITQGAVIFNWEDDDDHAVNAYIAFDGDVLVTMSYHSWDGSYYNENIFRFNFMNM